MPSGTSADQVKAILERDGGIILCDLLSSTQVRELNAELDPLIAALSPGGAGEERLKMVHGAKTKRLTGLTARCKAFRDHVLEHDRMLSYIDAVLRPHADTYWLGTAQLIEIGPGERAQVLHRDLESYPHFRDLGPAGPEVSVNCLIALTNFTEELGATRVVPGSHLWPDFSQRGHRDMTIPAIMTAGSALIFSCKLVHGGGANHSTHGLRRGLSCNFNLGWLMPEEAHPFLIPLDLARTLTPRAQQLLGFRSFKNESKNAGPVWLANFEELGEYLDVSSLPARSVR